MARLKDDDAGMETAANETGGERVNLARWPVATTYLATPAVILCSWARRRQFGNALWS